MIIQGFLIGFQKGGSKGAPKYGKEASKLPIREILTREPMRKPHKKQLFRKDSLRYSTVRVDNTPFSARNPF